MLGYRVSTGSNARRSERGIAPSRGRGNGSQRLIARSTAWSYAAMPLGRSRRGAPTCSPVGSSCHFEFGNVLPGLQTLGHVENDMGANAAHDL